MSPLSSIMKGKIQISRRPHSILQVIEKMSIPDAGTYSRAGR